MSSPNVALVVDDEAHLRMFLKLVLKQLGFTEFYEAVNGDEGIDLYKKHKPDLVLMDVNMPQKEGLEALKEIIAFDPKAVVVMMTSVSSRKAVETSVSSGATYYIRKDTPKDEIIAKLQKVLHGVWGEH